MDYQTCRYYELRVFSSGLKILLEIQVVITMYRIVYTAEKFRTGSLLCGTVHYCYT